ncbi:MAG TPA: hypothetical protein DHV55_01220 [Clostridiaceae bacterium]|nr:hypothetical protein [Clostridiaceae bacterium]
MSIKENFCVNCDENREVTLKMVTIVHKIKDEEIPVQILMPHCVICGSQLSDLDIDEKHFDMALDEFRKRKKLLFPEQIKNLREKYGISQRAFARALGLAEPTINRYEQGAIQDIVYNNLLLLVDEPENMLKMAEQNKENLSEKEFNIIRNNVHKMQKCFSDEEKTFKDIKNVLEEKIEMLSNDMSNLLEIVNKNSHKIDKNSRAIGELDNKFGFFMREYRTQNVAAPRHAITWNTITKTNDSPGSNLKELYQYPLNKCN